MVYVAFRQYNSISNYELELDLNVKGDLIYVLNAQDFHLPAVLISSSLRPTADAAVAAPIRNECVV